MLVVALFVLASLSYASNAQTVQLAFIDNRDIPGGPDSFEGSTLAASLAISKLGNVCFCLIIWLCDVLLVSSDYLLVQ